MAWTDWIGYLASALIVMSFVLNELRLIRIVNICGCICFVIYGALQGPLWPIIIPNALLVLIHLQAFWRDSRKTTPRELHDNT